MRDIQPIIKDTVKKFKVIPYEINNGLCEEFAMEVIELMGGYQKDLFELTSDNFTDDNNEFKPEYLADYGDIGSLDPSEIDMGSHIWIYYNGKHYDAECVEGVENLFDLPFYKRRFNLTQYFTISKAQRLYRTNFKYRSDEQLQRDIVKLRDYNRYMSSNDSYSQKTLVEGGYYSGVASSSASGVVPKDVWLHQNIQYALDEAIKERERRGKTNI